MRRAGRVLPLFLLIGVVPVARGDVLTDFDSIPVGSPGSPSGASPLIVNGADSTADSVASEDEVEGGLRKGPGWTIVEFTATDAWPAAESSSVIDAALRLVRGTALGDEDGTRIDSVDSVVRGTLRDAHPLGEPSASDAWLVRVTSISVQRTVPSRDTLTVAVSLALAADDLRLLAAWTDPKETWVLPAQALLEDRALERHVINRHQSVDAMPVGAVLRSTIPEVLGSLWDWGEDLGEVGQAVLRPRWVLSTWPPRWKDGQATANDHPRAYWIVDAEGFVAKRYSATEYASGVAFMVADDDRAVSMASYIP